MALAHQEGNDIAESAEAEHLGRINLAQTGHLIFQGAEDLDTLDRVDAEVGLDLHFWLEQLRGIPCFLRHDAQRHPFQVQTCRLLHRPVEAHPGDSPQGRRAGGNPSAEEGDDIAEGAEAEHLGRIDLAQTGHLIFQGAEDLDTLDRVDAEVGLDLHFWLEQLRGIPCFLRHDAQRHPFQVQTCRRVSGWSSAFRGSFFS